MLSLTSGAWAVMEALGAWNWNIEWGIYSLHPCVSSLGGIPIFILKNAKEFFSCCFYWGSQNQSSELQLNSSKMCLISSCWCMSGFLIGEWEEKGIERREENIYSVLGLNLIYTAIMLYIVYIFRWHWKWIPEAHSCKLKG